MEKPENKPVDTTQNNVLETGARLNVFQKRDPFDDFMEHIDQEAERRAPTEAEKETMDQNLIQLGKIFEKTNNNWHIDGALNISILKGEYIGIHKDVDISLEAAELADTDQHVEEMGYGFFLSYPEDDSDRSKGHVMQRINFADGEQMAEGKHLMLAAIDEDGNILEGQSLNFVDVHIIERNAEGKPIGSTGVELPEEWFVGQEHDFKGQKINISHPAKVAYYKLHSERSYDKTDLEALAKTGTLSIEDVEEIAQIFEQEFANRQNQFETVIKDLLQKIKPGMAFEDVFKALSEHPVIAEKIKYIEPSIRAFAQAIADSEEMSVEQIIGQALAIFKVQESFDSKRAEIDAIRTILADQAKLKEIRGGLEK